MNQRPSPSAVDEAIERCDGLLERIDAIQNDMRASVAKAQAALADAIDQINQMRKP